jgi:eukaryotic-like serine/threonine-protein kinase
VKNGEEHDERVMAIASIALRQPPADRERYLRLACENDDLYRETADVVEQEEELRDFMKPPILKVERRCPFQAGQLLESQRFEIVREIGEGGMACVYEALDRKRNQRIAIKGAKTGFHRLLPSELNGALEVRHWNVCLVNEIHTAQAPDGEIDFLTMELLKGETLSAKVAASGPVPKAEAFDLACQLCSGLAAIHTKVLHRDLKSSNIILCPAPTGIRAVVTDFGLACGIGETGEWGGTPRYMAPEVWRGEPSSKASDIYALGVVLYEMVTGKPPFENPVDCLERTPRAPSTLVPELGPKWDRVILPCLKPDPGDRPADAALVLAELKRRPARKLPWAIAALVLAGALSVPQFRHWLVDIIWPPPSVRLAVLPPDAASDPAIAPGVLQDVAERVSHLRSGRRTVVVIPPSEVANNKVSSIQQAKDVLHATHALQTTIHREGDQFITSASVVDLDTRAHVRDFSGRYAAQSVGALPVALTGLVSLGLQLKGTAPSEMLSADATVPYDKGLYLLRRDDSSFDDAIPLFEQAALLDPRSPLPLTGMAEAQILKFQATKERTHLESAQRSLAAAESLSPDSVRVRVIAGMLNQTAGQYEKALNDYLRAMDLDPRNVEVLLHVASAYNGLDMNNEAIATYHKAIDLEPGYYDSYWKLGEFYYYHAKYAEAAEQFRLAIERAPGLFDAYNELAAALSDLGRYDEAEETLQASIRLRETADTLNDLGAIRAYQKRDREAVEYYQRALKLNQRVFIYWLNLGDASRRLGRLRDAAAAYEKGRGLVLADLSEDPHDGYARAYTAYFFARLGDRKRAEDEISQARALSPSDTKVMRRAVLTFEALGERDRSLDILASAPPQLIRELERHPDLADLCQDFRFKQVAAKFANGGS